jgi:hypothetical protein
MISPSTEVLQALTFLTLTDIDPGNPYEADQIRRERTTRYMWIFHCISWILSNI